MSPLYAVERFTRPPARVFDKIGSFASRREWILRLIVLGFVVLARHNPHPHPHPHPRPRPAPPTPSTHPRLTIELQSPPSIVLSRARPCMWVRRGRQAGEDVDADVEVRSRISRG